MKRLKLVEPSKEYEDQVMAYKEAFLRNHDSFDGCGGLEEIKNYDEWLDFYQKNTGKLMFLQQFAWLLE